MAEERQLQGEVEVSRIENQIFLGAENSKSQEFSANREGILSEEKKVGEDSNVIFIGGKPFMNYITGVVMQFTTKNQNEVLIRARGKFISKAVDVAEVARKKFLKESVYVKDVKIGSEDFQSQEGKKLAVSTVDITLSK